MHVLGLERKEPVYPGMKLEKPIDVTAESDAPVLMRPGSRLDRFQGKIFYAIMLDTCEDIYLDSFELFRQFMLEDFIVE